MMDKEIEELVEKQSYEAEVILYKHVVNLDCGLPVIKCDVWIIRNCYGG